VNATPHSDIDLYDERVLLDPYPSFKVLRDRATVVFLPQYDLHVLPRFKNVVEAMRSAGD